MLDDADQATPAEDASAGPALLLSLAVAAVLASRSIGPARRLAGLSPVFARASALLNQPRIGRFARVAGAAGFAVLVTAELLRRRRQRAAPEAGSPEAASAHAPAPTQTVDISD